MSEIQRSALKIYGCISVIFWFIPCAIGVLASHGILLIAILLKLTVFPLCYSGMAVALSHHTAKKISKSALPVFLMAVYSLIFSGVVQVFVLGGASSYEFLAGAIGLFLLFGLLPSLLAAAIFLGALSKHSSFG